MNFVLNSIFSYFNLGSIMFVAQMFHKPINIYYKLYTCSYQKCNILQSRDLIITEHHRIQQQSLIERRFKKTDGDFGKYK